MSSKRLQADFNGLFGSMLCLSHTDDCLDEDGESVQLAPGMRVTVFEECFGASGARDDLIAHGVVEPSPEWLQCKGSRWVLTIDGRGVQSQSDLDKQRT